MKRKLFKTVALLMALAMLAGIALTEETPVLPDDALDLGTQGDTVDLEIDEGGITKFENDKMPDNLGIDLTLGDFALASEVTYRFIVNEREYSFQVAHAGEEILCPVPPEAPKGKRFNGWKLADGTSLFVDADEDGKIDPVIVRDYELGTEVYVWAEFADPSESEQPAAELPADLKPLLSACLDAETKNRPRDFAAVERELKRIYQAVTGTPYPRAQCKRPYHDF